MFPICEGCASSGVLCESCEERVRKGELSEIDVILSTLLKARGIEGYISLKNLDRKLVIFATGKSAPTIIGKGGSIAKELSDKLGKRVAIISKEWEPIPIIESLARPSRLIGKNLIYKENGKEVVKLIFDKAIDEESVSLMKELAGDMEIGYMDPLKKTNKK
jgi:transcription antitermination factor NusA-like protein